MKIVIATDFFGSNLAEELAEGIPGADFVAAFDTEAQMRELADADGVVGWPPASVLKGASRLRWVHVPGMGIDAVLTDPTIAESDIIVHQLAGSAHQSDGRPRDVLRPGAGPPERGAARRPARAALGPE